MLGKGYQSHGSYQIYIFNFGSIFNHLCWFTRVYMIYLFLYGVLFVHQLKKYQVSPLYILM